MPLRPEKYSDIKPKLVDAKKAPPQGNAAETSSGNFEKDFQAVVEGNLALAQDARELFGQPAPQQEPEGRHLKHLPGGKLHTDDQAADDDKTKSKAHAPKPELRNLPGGRLGHQQPENDKTVNAPSGRYAELQTTPPSGADTVKKPEDILADGGLGLAARGASNTYRFLTGTSATINARRGTWDEKEEDEKKRKKKSTPELKTGPEEEEDEEKKLPMFVGRGVGATTTMGRILQNLSPKKGAKQLFKGLERVAAEELTTEGAKKVTKAGVRSLERHSLTEAGERLAHNLTGRAIVSEAGQMTRRLTRLEAVETVHLIAKASKWALRVPGIGFVAGTAAAFGTSLVLSARSGKSTKEIVKDAAEAALPIAAFKALANKDYNLGIAELVGHYSLIPGIEKVLHASLNEVNKGNEASFYVKHLGTVAQKTAQAGWKSLKTTANRLMSGLGIAPPEPHTG